jgi:hypothetical protein
MIYPQRLPKGGRPRRAGPREPSGSEREKDVYLAQTTWHEFTVLADKTVPLGHSSSPWLDCDHALLNLVKYAKLGAREFIVSLYWLCTDPAIAPRWRGREYLTRVTRFDFRDKAGCLAARRLIEEQLGIDVIKNLDKSAFERGFGADLSVLSDQLNGVWAAWCDRGTPD